ncbi:MAG: iron hydrogenase small subunit [Oscillospiraceae bacterium]|nr:iron hydrogenase small subunit [Oscillospiraceae bacterium]
MKNINFKVNGVELSAPEGSTILHAIQLNDIKHVEMEVPTLHYLAGVKEEELSGLGFVEVTGREGFIPAWSEPIAEGMDVRTDTPALKEAARKALSDILAVHDHDCVNCVRTDNCELQHLLFEYKVKSEGDGLRKIEEIDDRSVIVRDYNKCIRCGRCAAVCENIQSVGAIAVTGEGLDATVGPVSPDGLAATKCVNCGQCIAACPVGALYERDNTAAVFDALEDPNKFVIVQAAPSVRAAMGEIYDFPIGVDVEGRLAAALRCLGFDKVFDTVFAADLTIMEEANEFIERVQNGGVLPMMTSCCPGWIKFCEHEFHDLIPNLSTCKSPQQMFGAVAKSYYAEKMGINKNDIVVVSIMPCTAKKFEIYRDNQCGAGVPDVDISITTRELARMLRKAEIQFEAMPCEDFDQPLGLGTGAGVIFGATGGVMEAALRTATEKLTGETLAKLEFCDVRGVEGVKEASYNLNGTDVKVAVVSGLANARALMEKVKSGEADYQFIEVMACPGGCVNGGGQPIRSADVRAKNDLRVKRAEALYENDLGKSVRKSHENPAIIELYETYLAAPGGEKAHKLLHTSYIKR